MKKEFTIEKKCFICNDSGIINKGTKVEEPCPICSDEKYLSELRSGELSSRGKSSDPTA